MTSIPKKSGTQGLLCCLFVVGFHCVSASVSANPLPGEVQRALPATKALGQADLTFWGLAIYTARLWVGTDFLIEQFSRHAFGLELVYARGFESRDIVERSLKEMNQMGALSPEQTTQWRNGMVRAIPNVTKGDRLLAIHRPSEGIEFIHNGTSTGKIRDTLFARRFLDIWLSTQTSEPQLRLELLQLKPL